MKKMKQIYPLSISPNFECRTLSFGFTEPIKALWGNSKLKTQNSKPLSIIAVFILFSGCFGINKNTEQAQREAAILLENTENSLFWGDTHLHTANSPDAYAFGNRLGFEEAYRFAKGEVIEVDGHKVQLETPLDFLVIADHAEGFGIINELKNGNPVLMKDTLFQRWNRMLNGTKREGEIAGKEMPEALDKGTLPPSIKDPKIIGPIIKSIWNGYLDVADRYNEAGKFTALAGFEWSSMPNGNNMHRVVVFRDDKEKTGQIVPFSALQSQKPEDLWGYLKRYEEKTGGKVLAIPHNANMSNGRMFALTNSKSEDMTTDYATQRSTWEPLTEITQTKGQSESHPTLSPNDEFAGQNINSWSDGNTLFDFCPLRVMNGREQINEGGFT